MLDTGTIACAVHDRIDVLLLGHGIAARHRALRLIDPSAAADLKARAMRELGRGETTPSGPQNEPLGSGMEIRTRLSAWLAATPGSADAAA